MPLTPSYVRIDGLGELDEQLRWLSGSRWTWA